MRFVDLRLTKFGVFDQRTLSFGPDAGLTVVYGPNEAGKSTSLAAITDFLFGVPHFSPHSSVFGADVLRISATLQKADGQQLALRRRKGRSRTLADLNGAAVEESALAGLLGGTSRERFETLFGLDHHRLRRGGAQLLTADGDIGRLIVEASGGLRGLMERFARLDGQIDALFDIRRSERRAFYRALDAFEAADRAAKESSVTHEQYERARQAHEAAAAQLSELAKRRSFLSAAASRLERLVRVAPILRNLDQLRVQLADFTDLAEVPESFDRQVAEAQRARGQAADALAQAEAQRDSLANRLENLVLQPQIAAVEAEIRDAAERAIRVGNAREDRASRLRELAECNRQLDNLRGRLGLGAEEDLAPRLPPFAAIDAVRELAAAAQRRETALGATRERLAELEADVQRLSDATWRAAERGHDRSLGVSVAELAVLPSLIQMRDHRRRAAEDARELAQTSTARLGYESFEALEGAAMPAGDVLTQEITQREALATERTRLIVQRAAAEAAQGAATSEIAHLTAGVAVATDNALAEARERRTRALAPLRTAHLAGAWNASAAGRQAEVETADDTIRVADEVADRHATEAQRAAELAQAIKQHDTAAAEAAAANKAITALESQLSEREETFAAAFPEAVGRHPQLAALKTVLETRAATLTQWGEAQRLQRTLATDEAAMAGPMELLALAERACGLSAATVAAGSERVRAALEALATHEQAHRTYRRDLEELQKANAALSGVRETLSRLQTEEGAWRVAWTPAVTQLGLRSDTSVDQAVAAAMEWAAAQGVLTTIATIRRRLARMDQDEAALTVAVETAGAALGLALPEDAIAAAKMMQDRWTAHEDARRRREEIEPDLKTAVQTVKRVRQELQERTETLSNLATLVGVADADAPELEAKARAHANRRALRDEVRSQLSALSSAGDALSEAELRADWGGRDLDDLRSELRLTEEAAHQADTDRLAAYEAVLQAHAALEAQQDQVGVNRAVIAREAATAELHDVVERYVDLALARDLLQEAIDKVRSRQQDPLVTRAGVLFSAMTQGAYLGVGADTDAKGEPVVVGQSAKGSSILVTEMSDGTRDQLYLAFRLAGLEGYCAVAEPLPFVADDILVHFDDPRSVATLGVLADFAAKTQILLFTHHQSVRAAAEPLAAAGRAHIIDLDG